MAYPTDPIYKLMITGIGTTEPNAIEKMDFGRFLDFFDIFRSLLGLGWTVGAENARCLYNVARRIET